MKLTGSQIVAEVLLDHGVDTIFGYPGGTALNIYDELYKYSNRISTFSQRMSKGPAMRRTDTPEQPVKSEW